MKILITGAIGMIGTQMCSRLISLGYEVTGIDNFFRGTNESLDHLKSISSKHSDNFKFIDIDLRHDFDGDIFVGHDIVIHLADVVGGIKYVFENQWDLYNSNILIDANVVRAVERSNINKYIYVGTACSFPQQIQDGIDSVLYEQDKFPAHPESAYGWSKLLGELQTNYLSLKDDKDCANIIFHNVYGPWADFDLERAQVIPSLIKKASLLKDGENLEVWGSGLQSRSFIHTSDIVDFFEKMLVSGMEFTEFNASQLGGSEGILIADLAKIILREFGLNEDRITFTHPEMNGDMGRAPDLTLSSERGFTQNVSIVEGIHDLTEWAKEYGKI